MTNDGDEILSEYHADGLDSFPVRDMAEEIAVLRREVKRLRRQRVHARNAIRQAGDALHFDQDQRAAFDALVRGLYAEEALGGDAP